ncbi:MAG TPA: hypothetical protein VF691_07400 [Cytophagaceae bacterium]|jgi:hypothetical protein
MINNLEHSTHVYYAISKKQLGQIFGWPYADWLQSILVIVVLDLSVIVWIRLDRFIEAGIFEVLILILNLLYYQWPGIFEPEVNRRIAEAIFAAMFCFGVSSFAYIWSTINHQQSEEQFLLEKSESEILNLKTMLAAVELEKLNVISHLNDAKSSEKLWIEKCKLLDLELNQNRELLIEAKRAEVELGLIIQRDESARRCEHCNELLESIDSKRVHKGQCHLNPSRRKMGRNFVH